jgi:hypothetical protein
LIAVIVGSCTKPSDPTPEKEIPPPAEQIIVSKNITTGSFSEVSNNNVGLYGATIKINKPNTPVDGIEIVIPTNSFTSSQSI